MKRLQQFFIASVVLALTGCSTFHRDWTEATKTPALANSIDGPWAGEWRSEQNGHHGSLRCVIKQTSSTTYSAHFRARFLKIFRYTYLATLNGHETNGVVTLSGDADLGFLAGGVYSYQGNANPSNFHSTYRSKHDHGYYEMKRPE